MNDTLRAAVRELDTVATLESYDAAVACVDRVRTLPGADVIEPGLASRLLCVALRYEQPVEVVESHLRYYLAVSPDDDPDEPWRRCMAAASVVATYPSLVGYLHDERARIAAMPKSAVLDDALATSALVLERIAADQ